MDITSIPFNRLIEIERCTAREDGLLQLSDDPQYTNHIGTVHGAALFALAEASSGEFLLRHLEADPGTVIPVVRRADIKFRKPANGMVFGQGQFVKEDWDRFHQSLNRRKRAVITFQIQLLTLSNSVTVATASFDWFISVRSDE